MLGDVLFLCIGVVDATVIRPDVGNLSWSGMHLMTNSSGLTVWSLIVGRIFFVHLLLLPPREISWAAYWPITGGLLCPIALLLNCGRGAQGQAQPMKAN